MQKVSGVIVFCMALTLSRAAFTSRNSGYLQKAANVSTSAISPMALDGIVDCGVSKIVEIRLTGCTNAPCQVSAGSLLTLEINFQPREMHWDMEHRAIVMKEAELALLSEGPVPDSTVYPDQIYTFAYQFTVPSSPSGSSEMRLKVFQNYVHEICLSIPLRI